LFISLRENQSFAVRLGRTAKARKHTAKAFAVRFLSRRTAKGTRRLFARQSPFALRLLKKHTVNNLCRALGPTHGKKS
jgi:hypothetical protein